MINLDDKGSTMTGKDVDGLHVMINLDEFQRRVDQYFQCGQRNEPAGRLILDLMRALRKSRNANLKQVHDWIRSKHPDLPDLTEILEDN